MKRMRWIMALGFVVGSACGFSPYEAYLLSGQPTHVMLFAPAADGKMEELRSALAVLDESQAAEALARSQITHPCVFTKVLQGKSCFFVYFDYRGTNYLNAVAAFESVPQAARLAPLLAPHPLAKIRGHDWLQMEWINFIRGAAPAPSPHRFASVTRLKPEKEAEYRQLHQTTWPSVVDRMARMEYHNFSIFLVELGDEIYETFYAEFVGADADKDKMSSVADPTYARWVKLTDACQSPLPDAVGTWSAMENIERK